MIGAQKATITGTPGNQQATSNKTGSSQSSNTTQNPQGSTGSSQPSNTTQNPQNSNGSSNSSSNTNNSNDTVAKVGQTINDSSTGMTCTLVSVNTLASGELEQPKAGHEFIYVHVKLTNNGSSDADYNTFEFHIMDGNGNITDMGLPPESYTANNELLGGKLAPGGSVEGDIIFQAPIGDHNARLTWAPTYFGSSTRYMWNLGL
jgi:hypothetical protein